MALKRGIMTKNSKERTRKRARRAEIERRPEREGESPERKTHNSNQPPLKILIYSKSSDGDRRSCLGGSHEERKK
jgi:hypothetical protein